MSIVSSTSIVVRDTHCRWAFRRRYRFALAHFRSRSRAFFASATFCRLSKRASMTVHHEIGAGALARLDHVHVADRQLLRQQSQEHLAFTLAAQRSQKVHEDFDL